MTTEFFANNPVTTLGAELASDGMTITLVSGSSFSLGRHRVMCETEIMIITSRSGNTLTVEERGAEGTSAAVHPSGSTIAQIPTAGSLNSIRQTLDSLVASAGGTNGVWLVSGGEITRGTGDLDLDVASGTVDFLGTLVDFDADTVTLTTGDATHGRFDVIYVDNTGTIGVLEGTPAADPIIPQLDPTTQCRLGERLVPADTTDLDDVVETEVIYDEGSEWPETTNNGNGTVTGESTDDAKSGTKSVKFAACSNTSNRVDFIASANFSLSGFTNLVFWIKPTVSSNWNTMNLHLSFRNSSGSLMGNVVIIQNGTRGFDASSNTWQKITIAIDAFGVTNQTVRRLRLITNGSAVVTFYVDLFKLEGGVTANPQGYLTAVQDDTSPVLGGTLDADNRAITKVKTVSFNGEVDNGNSSTADTIDWTAGQKQKSTLTGVCTYTFTAPSGPCNLLLKLVQGGSGSYTVTWPASVKWPGGTAPTLSTAVGAVDIVTFYYDGTNYHGVASLAFAVPA
jgi:hypothetical protein